MNYNKLLNNCINEFPFDEPIFIEDIKNYLNTKMEFSDKKMKTIYVYINRLVKANVLDFFSKGVYYRAKIGKFGKKKLDINKVIERKYLKHNNQIKGYITGATLYNSLGLTTQIANTIFLISNECPNNNEYQDKTLNVIVRKPKIEITNDNYLYLQLFDLINNKDCINIEIDNFKEIVFDYIKNNNLEMEKIFKYAKLTKNKKTIEKLYDLV